MDVIKKGTLTSSINENGQATFSNLTVGDSIHLNINYSEPYKAIWPDSVYKINPNENIYLAAQLEGLNHVHGSVLYYGSFLPGVIVKLITKNGNMLDTTNQTGDYHFSIPEKSQMKDYPIWFFKSGFVTKSYTAYPETGQELNIVMEKK
jgi:hypothetical protein